MQQKIKKTFGLVATFVILLTSQTVLGQTKTSSSAFEIKNEDLKEYVGQYDPESSGQAFSITISLDREARLMAQPTNKSQPNTLMISTKKDFFDLSGTPLEISFNRDEDLKIVSLTFKQGAQSFTAKKIKTP